MKYDKDLNTSFLGIQLCVDHRCPIQAGTRPEREDRRLHPNLHPRRERPALPRCRPNAATWVGPPSDIVTARSLHYASLATSLFASFMAKLGKQWINRYFRNRGGLAAAGKSLDREHKLDGLEGWHFYLVGESLPVTLRLTLLLLGCALSRYLWTISRTVAGFILTWGRLLRLFYPCCIDLLQMALPNASLYPQQDLHRIHGSQYW